MIIFLNLFLRITLNFQCSEDRSICAVSESIIVTDKGEVVVECDGSNEKNHHYHPVSRIENSYRHRQLSRDPNRYVLCSVINVQYAKSYKKTNKQTDRQKQRRHFQRSKSERIPFCVIANNGYRKKVFHV